MRPSQLTNVYIYTEGLTQCSLTILATVCTVVLTSFPVKSYRTPREVTERPLQRDKGPHFAIMQCTLTFAF